ncbi:LexA DNA-binding domain protein [Acidithiobacillus ferrivorans]|uniref:LexA DNA-binding domain protein n=4 Tax=Acidithiobacillus TaxID=119977 RepID=A0A060UKA7_9PROT|nr:LexA DNA-binding domain protein [Acidithiobacillus ferrivorans]
MHRFKFHSAPHTRYHNMHCTTPAYNIAENGFYNTRAVSMAGKPYVIPMAIVGAMQAVLNAASDVPMRARLVLAQLVSCAKTRNLAEPVFPSVATLAKRVECSESTIHRHLKALVDAGYIERKPQGHKKRGGLAVVHTMLKHRVAAIVGLPYNPYGCSQRLLFDNKSSAARQQSAVAGVQYPEDRQESYSIKSPAPTTLRRPSNPVPHDKFVAVQQVGAHASIPEDLVFLLDKGAHVFQVCRWMARAREAAWKLSDLVQLRKEKILNAENPVGYLVSVLKAAERGEKITQYKAWGNVGSGEEDRAAANARKYLLDQETAMKRYGDTLVEWSSPGGPRWIKTGKDQCNGVVFMADPRADTAARATQTMSVVALDNYVHDGSAKVVHEYRQSYGEDRSKGLGLLQRSIRMLKGAGDVKKSQTTV